MDDVTLFVAEFVIIPRLFAIAARGDDHFDTIDLKIRSILSAPMNPNMPEIAAASLTELIVTISSMMTTSSLQLMFPEG